MFDSNILLILVVEILDHRGVAACVALVFVSARDIEVFIPNLACNSSPVVIAVSTSASSVVKLELSDLVHLTNRLRVVIDIMGLSKDSLIDLSSQTSWFGPGVMELLVLDISDVKGGSYDRSKLSG